MFPTRFCFGVIPEQQNRLINRGIKGDSKLNVCMDFFFFQSSWKKRTEQSLCGWTGKHSNTSGDWKTPVLIKIAGIELGSVAVRKMFSLSRVCVNMQDDVLITEEWIF